MTARQRGAVAGVVFAFMLATLVLCAVASLLAQAPTEVTFEPAPAYVDSDGRTYPVGYELRVRQMDGIGSAAFVASLGKPTPDASNMITAKVPQFATLPAGCYWAYVAATDSFGLSWPLQNADVETGVIFGVGTGECSPYMEPEPLSQSVTKNVKP